MVEEDVAVVVAEAEAVVVNAEIAVKVENVAEMENVAEAEMENVAEAEMENVVKVENAVVVVANAEVNAADVVLPQPSQPNNEQISPPRSLLIPACFDNQCFLALLLLKRANKLSPKLNKQSCFHIFI